MLHNPPRGRVAHPTAMRGQGTRAPHEATIRQRVRFPVAPSYPACSVQFSGGSLQSGQVSTLTFQLGSYALNGTWLGWVTWTTQFQVCGAPVDDGSNWSRCVLACPGRRAMHTACWMAMAEAAARMGGGRGPGVGGGRMAAAAA